MGGPGHKRSGSLVMGGAERNCRMGRRVQGIRGRAKTGGGESKGKLGVRSKGKEEADYTVQRLSREDRENGKGRGSGKRGGQGFLQ